MMNVRAGSSTDRRVSLGTLAVRPVAYQGTTSTGPMSPPLHPILDLRVRSRPQRRVPIFHETTNCYGFLDLAPGSHTIEIVDPGNRFLPRTVAVSVPDRRPLGDALARGASTLPSVAQPPLVLAALRPAPGSPSANVVTARWGTVRDSGGIPLPFAWIRLDTPQGAYVTYSDARGEYLAVLAFLRPVVATASSGAGESSDVDDTVVVGLRAHRLLTPVRTADPLAAFPANFDDLVPGTAEFGEVYDTAALVDTSTRVKVGTRTLLDLQQ